MSTSTKIRANISDIFIMFIFCLLAVANANPYILYTGYERIIYFVALAIYVVFTTINSGFSFRMRILGWVRVFLVIFMFIMPYLVGEGEIGNRYLHIVGIIIYPLIYEYTKRKDILKSTIIILMVITCITCIQTLLGLQSYSYASRVADHTASLQLKGVGGYTFIYAISLGSVLLFADILNETRGKITASKVIVWVLVVITIIKSQFVTGILIIVLGSLLSLLFIQRKSKRIKAFVAIICTFILIIIFWNPLLSLIQAVYRKVFSHGGRLDFIISQLSISPWQVLKTEFIYDRYPKMLESFSSIMVHPILGIVFSGTNADMFGNHSTILDTVAIWGIPLSVVYIGLMFCPFFTHGRKKNSAYTVPFVLSYLMLSLFNNIDCTSAFVVYIIGLYNIDIMNPGFNK